MQAQIRHNPSKNIQSRQSRRKTAYFLKIMTPDGYTDSMPSDKKRVYYLRAQCSLEQKQAANRLMQEENRPERFFVLNCIKEHFERLGIAWPKDEESNDS